MQKRQNFLLDFVKVISHKDEHKNDLNDKKNRVELVDPVFYKKMQTEKNIRLQIRNRMLKSPNLANIRLSKKMNFSHL